METAASDRCVLLQKNETNESEINLWRQRHVLGRREKSNLTEQKKSKS